LTILSKTFKLVSSIPIKLSMPGALLPLGKGKAARLTPK
jgi:hypothetical protein